MLDAFIVFRRGDIMSRPMNAGEKTAYKKLFPDLNVDGVVVTGEATPVYNCLAWTLGYTDRWIWPGKKASDFDSLYGNAGFKRAANGPIAGWGNSMDEMTHGCISGSGHGPRWESKLGQELRIQHGLTELQGAAYGRPLIFYAKAAAAVTPRSKKRAENVQDSSITPSEWRLLEDEVERLPMDIRNEFNVYYDQWKKTWRRADVIISSDPTAVRHSSEFLHLASMGPSILPLVVAKLADREEFFSLQLYDVLQTDPSLRIEIARDETILGGEQLRAAQVVRRWLSK
jgi:hypothetical protein